MSIDINKLYNQKVKNDTVVRLYINLPSNKIIPFVKEFIDRAYLAEFPATIKFLNTDDRCDTVIIYTDYSSASQVVKEIESIREDYPSRFEGVGGVNPLLARVNDYIGFGEKPENGDTYFKSRTAALSTIENSAVTTVLKENIVAKVNVQITRPSTLQSVRRSSTVRLSTPERPGASTKPLATERCFWHFRAV